MGSVPLSALDSWGQTPWVGSGPLGGMGSDGGWPRRGMARKPRQETAGGVFHIYARGNRKAKIFDAQEDWEKYMEMLGAVVVRHGWRCYAFCLMPNHVHLLVKTPSPNLGEGMRRLHGRYAHWFNERHGLSGHVFQGRFGAVSVTGDEQLATTVGYLATNPVKAGLVPTPGDWRWGSHQAIERDVVPGWLSVRELFELLAGAHGGDGRRRYDDLVAERGVTVSVSEVTAGAKGVGGSVVR
jgi:REP-associated tyrosine transposase